MQHTLSSTIDVGFTEWSGKLLCETVDFVLSVNYMLKPLQEALSQGTVVIFTQPVCVVRCVLLV